MSGPVTTPTEGAEVFKRTFTSTESPASKDNLSDVSTNLSCMSEPEEVESGSEAASRESDAEPVEDLATQEDRLRSQVPKLLDSMNRASDEVNSLERQANAAQARYKLNVNECSKFYDELRNTHGRAFDRVKPYFSAEQEVKAASHRMQSITSEFSLAASRHAQAESEGCNEDERLRLMQERDRLEADYARSLGEHRAAKATLEALRAQLGDAAIQRALPAFESLQQRQLKLAVEYNRMNSLSERAQFSKAVYQSSMRELERISSAVHDIRKAHQQQSSSE